MPKDPRASHPDFTPTDPPPAKRTLGAPVERILTRPMPTIELRDACDDEQTLTAVPSKAPAWARGVAAVVLSVPPRHRWLLILTAALGLMLAGGILTYMIYLGHVPSWFK